MDSAIISLEHLVALYRFALLLTGSAAAAESVVAEVLAEVSDQASQIRSIRSRNALLVSQVRARCLKRPPGAATPEGGDEVNALTAEARDFVQRSSRLAEPGRSALALFYIDLFPAEEVADLLHLSLERLGDALEGARATFRDAAPMENPAPSGTAGAEAEAPQG